MSLQRNVLDAVIKHGALSNAELRDVLLLDQSAVGGVNDVMKDLVAHGWCIKHPRDAVTPMRIEAVPGAAARLATPQTRDPEGHFLPTTPGVPAPPPKPVPVPAPVTSLKPKPVTPARTPSALRAEACVLLLQAGDAPMGGTAHERLLSLIARAELENHPQLQGSRQ